MRASSGRAKTMILKSKAGGRRPIVRKPHRRSAIRSFRIRPGIRAGGFAFFPRFFAAPHARGFRAGPGRRVQRHRSVDFAGARAAAARLGKIASQARRENFRG